MSRRTYSEEHLRAQHDDLCRRLVDCRNTWAEIYPRMLLVAERRGDTRIATSADIVEKTWEGFEGWLEIPYELGGTAAIKDWLNNLEESVKAKETALAGARDALGKVGPLSPVRRPN